MPLTACTIQEVLSTDNPNQGRVKINNNFECLENTINELQVAANTGTTIVDAGTNVGVALSYSGSSPLYTISVVSSPTFSSLSSTTISTDGLVLSSIGTGTSVATLGIDSGGNVVSSTTASVSSYWTSGSSGSYSIKADNDSGLDAIGDYAVAEGAGSLASGVASHAEGDATTAFGQSSHAEGSGSYSSGSTSHAEGNGTTSIGAASHSEGTATTSIGNSSHAEGSVTISTGNYSHAEGYSTTALGSYSHAEGNNSTAQGSISHAEGNSTKAIGDQAHSEGFLTTASGGSSHAEGRNTTAIGDYSHVEGYQNTSVESSSHAGGSGSIASGATSFIHSTNSLVTGARSVVLGGQNITGTTADTVYVPRLNVQTIGSGTPITSLSIDSIGNIVSGASLNLGRVLFVSESGNNSTAQRGDINKPWKDLYIAKSAATSGDTVVVFPQTIVYDNRAAAGNPWNGRQAEMNLWKDGVTYYFMPGAKIVVYNQTVSGQDLYLIRPNGDAFETCTVLGHLDYQQNGSGPDTSVGRNLFFQGTTIGAESGYTFYAEVKNITSNHCEAVNIERESISIASSSVISKITIISQTENYAYLGGQSASGAFNIINFGDNVTEIKLYSKYRNYGGYYPWYILGNMSRSKINFYGDEVYNSGNNLCVLRDLYNGIVHININNIYYNTAYTPFGFYGAVISTISTGGWTCNLTANLVDYAANSQTVGLFYLTTANNTINFKGNITTNTNSGAGRFIAATTQPNTINIDGDISLIGTATTTQVLLQPNGGATINYKGKITGNYGGPLIKTYNGTMNVNNSFIQITTDNSNAQIFQNGGASSGTCRINNSYVEMRNNSGALSNGSYVKALINNSTIINSGTGTTLSNATNFGSLQLINSTIMTSGSTSILYTSAGTPVVSSNSVANVNYNIANITGTINVINELTY